MKNLRKMQEVKERNSLERELGQLLEQTLKMECELYSVINYKRE
jgi:hypothetical protein